VNTADIFNSIRWNQLLLSAAVLGLIVLLHWIVLRPVARKAKADMERAAKRRQLLGASEQMECIATAVLLRIAGNGLSAEKIETQLLELQEMSQSLVEHTQIVASLQTFTACAQELLAASSLDDKEFSTLATITELQQTHRQLSHAFVDAQSELLRSQHV
jgi:hypothetical protein